jgi:hypothetical protein
MPASVTPRRFPPPFLEEKEPKIKMTKGNPLALLRDRIWHALFRRRIRAKSVASVAKHPVRNDFHTAVTQASLSVTFKPTNSIYIFGRCADNSGSFAGVQHAGHNTGDYPSDEVQDMAQQIASEHARIPILAKSLGRSPRTRSNLIESIALACSLLWGKTTHKDSNGQPQPY